MFENDNSVIPEGGLFVNAETIGTIIKPASIQNAPALIGERRITGNILAPVKLPIKLITMNATANIKFTQHAALVVPFQNSEYRNGARNAPANAPHEIPIS